MSSPNEGYNPRQIEQTGWGLVTSADIDPQTMLMLYEALRPLLDLRRSQAGPVYREFTGESGVRRDESAAAWLGRNNAVPYGPINPAQVPYYLMIASPLDEVAYQFQTDLASQYAVSRLWFQNPLEWRAYAESVVRAETTGNSRPAQLEVFSPTHPNDAYTAASSLRLKALAGRLNGQPAGYASAPIRAGQKGEYSPSATGVAAAIATWSSNLHAGDQASVQTLLSTLIDDAPALILAGGHSLILPADRPEDDDRAAQQGALICALWPGPGQPITDSMTFSAESVPDDADLCGMVFMQYSSFSLGVLPGEGTPLISRLPQRLLSLSSGRGALAAAGWVDRIWTVQTEAQANQEMLSLESCLHRLMEGYPAGDAFRLFSSRNIELQEEISSKLEQADFTPVDSKVMAGLLASMSNARGFSLFGDPAVRLRVRRTGISQPSEPVQSNIGYENIIPAAQDEPINLEITLSIKTPEQVEISFRTDDPIGEVLADLPPVHIELDQLTGLDTLSVDQAADRLGQILFAEEHFRNALMTVRQLARDRNHPLRISLGTDSSLARLQTLDWEQIKDPASGEPVLTGEKVYFSRYLSSPDWRQCKLRPKSDLRALVIITSPSNISDYGRQRLDIARETRIAKQILQGFPVEILNQPLTQPALENALTRGVDIIYLACPLVINRTRNAAALFIERVDGTVQIYQAASLAEFISNLPQTNRPRLVVVGSPAGSPPDPGALASLAASLAEVGVLVVMGLQGKANDNQAAAYYSRFFQLLRENGFADRAACDAYQYSVRGGWATYWPVVFTRLRTGRIWYEPGYSSYDDTPVISGERVDAAHGADPLPAEFEIYLSRQGIADYAVSMRFMGRTAGGAARINFAALQALGFDVRDYGQALFETIFSDQTLENFYRMAAESISSTGQGIRLRIAPDPAAAELHDLRWECLYDDKMQTYLFQNSNFAPTRYLTSPDWSTISLPNRPMTRALVVVCSPTNLRDLGLRKLDIPFWANFGQSLFEGLKVDTIVSESGPPLTLDTLLHQLSEGYDIAWIDTYTTPHMGENRLVLEDDQRKAALVGSRDLSARLRGLTRLPRLVILGGSLTVPAALSFSEAGTHAVLAQNGYTSAKMLARYLEVFTKTFLDTGQADLAAASARSQLREQPDWWMPTLITRIKSARLWEKQLYK